MSLWDWMIGFRRRERASSLVAAALELADAEKLTDPDASDPEGTPDGVSDVILDQVLANAAGSTSCVVKSLPPPTPDLGAIAEAATREAEARFADERVALAEGVRRALSELQSWTRERVRNVTDTTSREVLGAGGALDAIVREAQGYIDETKRELARLTRDDDATSVANATAAQISAVTEYLQKIDARSEEQSRAAEDAQASLERVILVAQRIGKLAQSARILSLNASVEAARLASGSAFAVIAHEMTAMTEEVRQANGEVRDIAEALQRTLPSIANQARLTRKESQAFGDAMREHMDHVGDAVDELRSSLRNVLEAGDERLAGVLSSSQTALSHLQFEDSCAQALRIIDRDILDVAERVCHHVAHGSSHADPLDGMPPATAHRDLAAGEVMALAPRAVAARGAEQAAVVESGEVMLF